MAFICDIHVFSYPLRRQTPTHYQELTETNRSWIKETCLQKSTQTCSYTLHATTRLPKTARILCITKLVFYHLLHFETNNRLHIFPLEKLLKSYMCNLEKQHSKNVDLKVTVLTDAFNSTLANIVGQPLPISILT